MHPIYVPHALVVGLTAVGFSTLIWVIIGPILVRYFKMDKLYVFCVALGGTLGTGICNALIAHWRP